MSIVKSVYVGAVVHNKTTIRVFTSGSQNKLLYDINWWLFDFFRVNNIPIIQLPPLDDWTLSKEEDNSFWSITLDGDWTIWIRSDILEFS